MSTVQQLLLPSQNLVDVSAVIVEQWAVGSELTRDREMD